MKKQKSAFRCAMGFMLLVAGCSSGGGQNPGMTSGQVDMAVGDNPDGGGDPSKDMSGQPPEDMAGMPPVDLAYTSGLPCTPVRIAAVPGFRLKSAMRLARRGSIRRPAPSAA